MSYSETQFNKGVELAYVLYDALGLDAELRGGRDDVLEEVDELSERLFEIGTQYERTGGGSERGSRRHFYVPEPYESIAKKADHMFFAAEGDKYMDKDVREYSAELIELLTVAVDGLIGPDVYIQGMNPHGSTEDNA